MVINKRAAFFKKKVFSSQVKKNKYLSSKLLFFTPKIETILLKN